MKTSIRSYFLALKKNRIFLFHTLFKINEIYTALQSVLLH